MEYAMNKVSGIFGRRGCGKTTFLLAEIIPVYLQKQMKILIIDTFDHPSYRKIPVLDKKKFPLWKKGVYRVFVPADEIPDLNYFINSQISIWNTLIVYEDAYKHTFKSIDRNLVQLMADSKQKNIDIVFMYHSWMQAPPDLFRFIDFIEVFKTKDSPESRKNFMPGYFDEAMNVWKRVMQDKNNFAHELLDTGL